MSRGFVKEEDQEEIPLVPPRAHLPEGVTNYVTRPGMDALLNERQQLLQKKEQLEAKHENEKRIAANHINALLQLLNERIATAKIVEHTDQPQDEVRFGALVTLKVGDEKQHKTYRIVGVDEADITQGKISFISPIARALIHKKVGEKAVLKLANNEKVFEVIHIAY